MLVRTRVCPFCTEFLYVHILSHCTVYTCIIISLRGGRSPKVSLGVQLLCDLFRIYFRLFQGLLRVGLDFLEGLFRDYLGFVQLIFVLFRVVLGFAHGCFRVYLGLFSVELGLVQGWFRVYLGFIQGQVISVFFQSLAVR